jgi:hypothetical protein
MPMAAIGTQEVPEKVSTGSTEQAGQSYKGFFVPHDQVASIWEYVLPHIQAAVDHSEGELEANDVFAPLCMGDMQLWVVVDGDAICATLVTEIITYPRKRILRILSLGGRGLRKWYYLFPEIEKFAVAQGCDTIEAWARKGFEKMLPDWKSSYQVLTKELRKDK